VPLTDSAVSAAATLNSGELYLTAQVEFSFCMARLRQLRLLFELRKGSREGDAERTTAVEKANEDLKESQADLQRRWQYLAEAQRLSHSRTFGWKVRSGELVWSDETYKILGFARETNPTLDLVFDTVHPDDPDRVRQLSDRTSKTTTARVIWFCRRSMREYPS
jgi:succinate dehydrogenase flavin-adding protein (antitoxin of CptAB toxin-antitoxin module)